MILCDTSIRRLALEEGMIEPFSECVQGIVSYGLSHAGYDLRLGYTLDVFKNTRNEIIDPARFSDPEYVNRVLERIQIESHGSDVICIPPHSYILAHSLELLRIPRWLQGECRGKSTYARTGLIVNCTPAEPAWRGHLTIEIANTSPAPVRIYPGLGIAQMKFEMLDHEPEVDYAQKRGKYQNQKAEPVAPRVKE